MITIVRTKVKRTSKTQEYASYTIKQNIYREIIAVQQED